MTKTMTVMMLMVIMMTTMRRLPPQGLQFAVGGGHICAEFRPHPPAPCSSHL